MTEIEKIIRWKLEMDAVNRGEHDGPLVYVVSMEESQRLAEEINRLTSYGSNTADWGSAHGRTVAGVQICEDGRTLND